MARFENKSRGLRGVVLAGGDIVWIEAGEAAEIDGKIATVPDDVERIDGRTTAAKPVFPKSD